MLPSVALKKIIMGRSLSSDQTIKDPSVLDSIHFMAERINTLSQSELASRLTLNCAGGYVQPQRLGHIPITIIDVFDKCAISQSVREELYKLYPHGKRAHLKKGGNFPYISDADQVNLHICVHLRAFHDSRLSPLGDKLKPQLGIEAVDLQGKSTPTDQR